MFYVNVEAAIHKDGKWIVISRSMQEEHAGGLLSLVGGTVEKEGNATSILETTLKREVFEEVGVQVKDKMDYVRSTSFRLADGSEVLDMVFLCEIEQGDPYPKSPDEVEAVLWMTTDEIINHPQAPIWLIDSIKDAEALLKEK